jgi:hypothetical protein
MEQGGRSGRADARGISGIGWARVVVFAESALAAEKLASLLAREDGIVCKLGYTVLRCHERVGPEGLKHLESTAPNMAAVVDAIAAANNSVAPSVPPSNKPGLRSVRPPWVAGPTRKAGSTERPEVGAIMPAQPVAVNQDDSPSRASEASTEAAGGEFGCWPLQVVVASSLADWGWVVYGAGLVVDLGRRETWSRAAMGWALKVRPTHNYDEESTLHDPNEGAKGRDLLLVVL